MELGQPPLVWQWAVVSGETQVLNSNSTSAVQDPLDKYNLYLPDQLWTQNFPEGARTPIIWCTNLLFGNFLDA